MKLRFTLLTLVALMGCLNATPPDQANISTTDQETNYCRSDCLPPAYNGVPVSCTSNIACLGQSDGATCLADDGVTLNTVWCAPLVCGDGVCTYPYENTVNCQADCGYCGDGTCGPNESRTNCALDCGCPDGLWDCCGNGVCSTLAQCGKPGWCGDL